MIYDEYIKVHHYFEGKALALLKHERKAYAKTGFTIDNYSVHEIDGKIFYKIQTNVFKAIIGSVYLEAHEKFPLKFETGNADDILEALFEIEPILNYKNFTDFLQNEQFAFIIPKNGDFAEGILRIDLFRQLNFHDNKREFTGGIFHVLKHFSHNGRNLSICSQIHNIASLEGLIELAIKAFFISNGHYETSSKFVSTVKYDERHSFKFVFYVEEKTNVYFIKTIHQKRIKLPRIIRT